MWKFVSTYDYVSGDFMWTGIDYLGESKLAAKSQTPRESSYLRLRKDTWYFCQSSGRQTDAAHIPALNGRAKKANMSRYSATTNCDSVELFLNGKIIGIQSYWFPRSGMQGEYEDFRRRNSIPRTTEDLHLTWTVALSAGQTESRRHEKRKRGRTEEISDDRETGRRLDFAPTGR